MIENENKKGVKMINENIKWKESPVAEFGENQIQAEVYGITLYIFQTETGSFGARSSDGSIKLRGMPTLDKAKRVVHAVAASQVPEIAAKMRMWGDMKLEEDMMHVNDKLGEFITSVQNHNKNKGAKNDIS